LDSQKRIADISNGSVNVINDQSNRIETEDKAVNLYEDTTMSPKFDKIYLRKENIPPLYVVRFEGNLDFTTKDIEDWPPGSWLELAKHVETHYLRQKPHIPAGTPNSPFISAFATKEYAEEDIKYRGVEQKGKAGK
jgi:hypothetical protein